MDSPWAVIVMDFSSFLIGGLSANLLVIDVLIPHHDTPIHQVFVLFSRRAEDVFFVLAGVDRVLRWLSDKTQHLLVFTDGGPAHFRCTSYVQEWGRRKRENRWIRALELRYFAPYHGSYVCDGIAAIVKRKLGTKVRNVHHSLTSLDMAAEVIATTGVWDVSVVGDKEPSIEPASTFRGLKNFYVWYIWDTIAVAFKTYEDARNSGPNVHTFRLSKDS